MPNIVHIMKEWEYTFGPVSKEEWIRQIETDLRQKPLASTYSEWWPGASLNPFFHPEDSDDEIVRLPDVLFGQPPGIAEWVETESLSADTINQRIRESLQFGAQSILLQADVVNISILNDWLRGVLRDLVSVSLTLPFVSINELLLLQENERNPVFIRIERKELSPSFSSLLEDINQKPGVERIRFAYRFPSTGTWDIETASTFKGLINDLAIWESSGMSPFTFFNQCILVLEADHMYFKHILQTRILQLLWLNLKTQFINQDDIQTNQYLECHVIPEADESSDQFLIRASMSGLAASLCGTHTLCFHPSRQPGSQVFYKRINRNIHHLLALESGMYRGTDPLAGSYALDYHTKMITTRIWKILMEKI